MSTIVDDSPTNADRFIDRLTETFQLLEDSPGLGRKRPELGADLRSFPTGRYLILYRQTPGGIEVPRVLSAYRDIEALEAQFE